MLPERIFNAIEIGSLKEERERITEDAVRRPRRAQDTKRLFRGVSVLLTLSVSLFSIGVIASGVVTKRSELSAALFDVLLRASFPSAAQKKDIPVSALPEDKDTPPTELESTDSTHKEDEATPPSKSENADESIYDFDRSTLPEGSLPIVPIDLSMPTYDRFYMSNETPYSPDLKSLSKSDGAVAVWNELSSDAPLVLIVHTHATEAYSEDGALWYEAQDIGIHTEDTSKNVVAVGAVVAEVLQGEGIPTLHCTTLHDKESYKDSYSRCAQTIKSYLEKYPTIRYVFDIHRDSLIRDNGDKLRPITELDGKIAAQVMSVVGTDYKGAAHPDWSKNLTLAARLQEQLDQNYAGLARRIYLRGASFNQQYTTGSLLLEIGSCGNSLEEAKYSAELVGRELAKIIKGS